MANKEQDYEPQAKPADEVTKQCQEFIRLYPTRWALTDSAFEKIKNTGTIPTPPKGIAEIVMVINKHFINGLRIFLSNGLKNNLKRIHLKRIYLKRIYLKTIHQMR